MPSVLLRTDALDEKSVAVVTVGVDREERFWASANVPIDQSSNPWLPPALVSAMSRAESVQLTGQLDRLALSNASLAQSLLKSWFKDMTAVDVSADALMSAEHHDGRGVGSFFSGGVDSFHVALCRPDITHLIFVHGFDVEIADERLAQEVILACRAAAAELGKELIEVRTDLRRVDWGVPWTTKLHGAALAAVALMLSPHLAKVIIPASFQLDDLYPFGSHPDLDPLWSSSAVAIEHFGTEYHRTEKVAALAQSPIALRHLRICTKNPDGVYNCGRCEKCTRTMINLHAVGALQACRTLPDEIDPRQIKNWAPLSHAGELFASDNIAALEGRSDSKQIVSALRGAIRRTRIRRMIRRSRIRRIASRVKRALRS